MQLFLSLSGIVLSAILLYFNARNNKSTIYLGVMFLLGGMHSFSQYTILHSGSVTLAALGLAITGIIPFLTGPVLYFYIRSVLSDDPNLKKTDWWHLMPVLLFLVIESPYLLSSWTFKTEVAGEFIAELNRQDHINTAFLGNKVLVFVVFILSKVAFLAYVLWSAGLLFSFLKNKREREVFFRLQSTIKWIKAFLAILIIPLLAHIWFMVKIFAFGDLSDFDNLNLFLNLLGIGPIAILLLTFFSPGILYGLPRIPAQQVEVKLPKNETENGVKTEKSILKKFESSYLQSIGCEADACMEKFQPYTNHRFSLSELSLLINIPEHHLGYYFREEKKQSFTEYRNEWRVKHARNLMDEGKNNEMTLEAIGMLSGFPNRDSFRTAFQRIEGITPAAFISKKQE